MMKINPYVPIVRNGNSYIFGVNGFFSIEERDKVNLNENQISVMNELSNGSEISDERIIDVFGNEITEFFIINKILISSQEKIDVNSIYSRSKAYYFFNKMGDVQKKLNNSVVLVLGCGGIGSHVSWNLATMGVGKIILVDFDVVEESNLNRQLMYSMNDIGKLKTEVLKEKLTQINPNITIETINKKIWSQTDLEEVVDKANCNLIVKSLDSPARFPLWLDNVCQEKKIAYVSGITVSTSPMIGPTFIPGRTVGYTNFFEDTMDFNHVSGISQSLGVIMYDISSEISLEVFKYLTGKGKLKFTNTIHVIDEMNNRVLALTPKEITKNVSENENTNLNLINLILMLIISLILTVTNNKYLIVLNAALAIVFPLFIYRNEKNINRSVFLNLIVFLTTNIIYLFENNINVFAGINTISIINTLFVMISFYIIMILILFNLTRYLLNKAFNKETRS